jgi:glycosyltransferase involved in cell wall biosynthesis
MSKLNPKESKIALALMVKDTEPLEMITRGLDSVLPYIQGSFITITHNTKNPSKKAKELSRDLKVYCLSKGYIEPEISYFKWVKDFAVARNFNWGQVPRKFEWVTWIDADDVLVNGSKLHDIKRKGEEIGASSIFFNYIYKAETERTESGEIGIKNILIEHLRERLIRNDGSYKWEGPIHETLIEQRATNKTDNRDAFVLHLSSDERSGEAIKRNIEILKNTLEKQGEEKDPRIVYYLGKAHFDLHTPEDHDIAEDLITAYLEGSRTNVRSGWEEERAQAWQYLGEIHRGRRQFNKAIKCISNAIIEGPKFPQFYIDMALTFVYQHRWDKALHWARLYEKIPPPRTTLVLNPRDTDARFHEVMFNIGVNTNNVDVAFAAITKLRKMFPNDEGVKQRYMSALRTKIDNETVTKFINIANYLKDMEQEDRIPQLIKSIPDDFLSYPVVASLVKDFLKPKTWKKNEITIVCGPGFEKWSPDNISKGIGGSEEAVIYLSREFAKQGWDVTVYGDPPDEFVESMGKNTITYKSHLFFNPMDNFNVLIGWRMIGFFDRKWNAKKTYLWLHDVQNPLEYTKERVDNIDKIFVLSEAHKKTILNAENKEWLPDDKFLLTGNGINLAHFDKLDKKPPVRDHKRLVWTSSYDRGLEHLLDIWPDVLAEVPDAKLDIYYGWNLFDSIHHNNPERKAWKHKVDQKMKQDGITHIGRVGQEEILEATYGAGIWAYPTHFYEISCITAMKCQAAGAIPVVTDYAALEETVQHGVKIDVSEDDIYDDEIKKEFSTKLIEVLKMNEEDQKALREPMIEWARNKFSWKGIADQWIGEFNVN